MTKMSSFKNRLVRIAHTHSELRGPILKGLRRVGLSNLERTWGGYSSFGPRRHAEDEDEEEED